MTESEFYVLPGSVLIGRTLGYLVEEYHVEVKHLHNPQLSPKTRCEYDPKRKIEPRLIIKISGSWDNVNRVLEDSA